MVLSFLKDVLLVRAYFLIGAVFFVIFGAMLAKHREDWGDVTAWALVFFVSVCWPVIFVTPFVWGVVCVGSLILRAFDAYVGNSE